MRYSPVAPGYSRTLIFLTDGGISGHEEQAVYDLVAQGSKAGASPVGPTPTTTVLCLGIGHGVHRGLLDGMAGRSEGAAGGSAEPVLVAGLLRLRLRDTWAAAPRAIPAVPALC